MTKKQRQQFIEKAKELLLSLGAKQTGDDFILDTRVGRLWSPRQSLPKPTG